MTGLVILAALFSTFIAGCVFALGKMVQAEEAHRAQTSVQRRVRSAHRRERTNR